MGGALPGVLFAALLAAAVAEEQQGCNFLGKQYEVGERWVTGPPDKCAKYLCEGHDQIAALTCPWFLVVPGCSTIPGDETAVYPGCCPLRKCHEPSAASLQDKSGATTANLEISTVITTEAETTTISMDSTSDIFTPTMTSIPEF